MRVRKEKGMSINSEEIRKLGEFLELEEEETESLHYAQEKLRESREKWKEMKQKGKEYRE